MGKTKRERTRPPRARETLFLYGFHPVRAALGNPARELLRLRATAEGLERLRNGLADRARARLEALPILPADRRALDKAVGDGAAHQGLVLEAAPLAALELDRLAADAPDNAFLVILDQVTDPQNVGAIIRSAAVFGAAAVITTERHAPAETGALAKAAAGALEQVPYVTVTNLARGLEMLKSANFWIIGLDGAAETALADVDLGPRRALVLGAEGTGLRRLTREACDVLARIPAPGLAPEGSLDSLNVSTAAAVGLYELLARHRRDP